MKIIGRVGLQTNALIRDCLHVFWALTLRSSSFYVECLSYGVISQVLLIYLLFLFSLESIMFEIFGDRYNSSLKKKKKNIQLSVG